MNIPPSRDLSNAYSIAEICWSPLPGFADNRSIRERLIDKHEAF